MSWCQTYKGHVFWPLEPEREQEILIEIIAHSLALQCRYNGHCNEFYSVAEHSVLIARELYMQTGDKNLALKGLLHDATEAYLGDIPRPIKQLWPGFKELENRWHIRIFNHFGLSTDMPEEIKISDYRMLKTEAEQIMEWPPPQSWNFPEGIEPYDIKIICWSPKSAEQSFLHWFNFLTS